MSQKRIWAVVLAVVAITAIVVGSAILSKVALQRANGPASQGSRPTIDATSSVPATTQGKPRPQRSQSQSADPPLVAADSLVLPSKKESPGTSLPSLDRKNPSADPIAAQSVPIVSPTPTRTGTNTNEVIRAPNIPPLPKAPADEVDAPLPAPAPNESAKPKASPKELPSTVIIPLPSRK